MTHLMFSTHYVGWDLQTERWREDADQERKVFAVLFRRNASQMFHDRLGVNGFAMFAPKLFEFCDREICEI